MNGFKFNIEKAINSLLYICHSQSGNACDMYNLLKIIFFADSDHLFKYGRPITGDTMFSMKYGPVPSECYDMVKPGSPFQNYFQNEQNIVEAKQKPNMGVFSQSDIECLDKSISENAGLAFPQLRDKSHTAAYEKTKKEKGLDRPISVIDIAREDGHLNPEMIKYITSRFEY